jgi:hypothetical protein
MYGNLGDDLSLETSADSFRMLLLPSELVLVNFPFDFIQFTLLMLQKAWNVWR